jgi:hypothetical protein
MSKRNKSEYDIYVNLENLNGGDVPLPELASTLKRQFSYIKIEDDLLANNTTDCDDKNTVLTNESNNINSSIATDQQDEQAILDTENTERVNSNGEKIRKSKINILNLLIFNNFFILKF